MRLNSLSTLVKAGIPLPPIKALNNHLNHLFKAHNPDQALHLFDQMPHKNTFTHNIMIHGSLAHNLPLSYSRALFDSAPLKDAVTFNSMILGYAAASLVPEAAGLMDEMRSGVGVDQFTLTTVLNACADSGDLRFGRQIHGLVVRTGCGSDGFGISALVDMYSKCGCFRDATKVFEGEFGVLDSVSRNAMVAACCREGEISLALELFRGTNARNDVVSWNTMISGCASWGCEELAFELFMEMGGDGIRKNEHTVSAVLLACCNLKSLRHGKQVHGWVLRQGFESNLFVSSGVVNFYCKCNELRYAELVRIGIREENLFSTTSLIVGYSQRGNMEEARRLFDSLSEKNSVVWTAILNGYVKSEQFDKAFDLFRAAAVKHDPMVSDMLVLITLLGACAMQADIDHGKQIHGYIMRICTNIEEKLGTALVDMYAKCGRIEYAEEIYKQCFIKDRVLYNAMMAGFAHNGRKLEAIWLFKEMLRAGLQPDAVTFIALLTACRHAGLVELGENYFNAMTKDHGIVPEIDHYSSMVDLLGRANRLDEAVTLIKSMPFEPDAIIWGTLLNACRMNKNTELAKDTEEKLLSVAGQSGARYVQLANAFASKGEWAEVERVRRKMRGGDVRKHAGCSWLQVENKVSAFTSGDRFHSEVESIYEMLGNLNTQMMDEDIVLV